MAISDQPVSTLFVYGTLRPGDVRWPLLEPFVADAGEPDAVAGELFDTGCGYPAARFASAGVHGAGRDAGLIVGRRYELLLARLDAALLALDAEESSVAGGFRRVLVTTRAGHAAWAYRYGSGLTLTPITSGDWLDR